MAPKRKQVDEATGGPSTSTRSTTRATTAKETASSYRTTTRKSGRRAAKNATTTLTTASSNGEGNESTSDGTVESAPPTKRIRTTGGPKSKKKSVVTAGRVDDDTIRKSYLYKDLPLLKVISNSEHRVSVPTCNQMNKPPPSPKEPVKAEPYTPQRALQLFQTYTDEDDPSVITAEGFMQLCLDAGMTMEGALPIILAWQLDAKEMARITKEEWLKGTNSLKICSVSQISAVVKDLEDLLILGKPPLKQTTKKDQDPYDRTLYFGYASNVKAAFQKLYSFSFSLVKPTGSKNIEMETSTAFWNVLLVPKYPIMGEIIHFINEKAGTYKATNKDLWSMILEFCDTVSPTLENYDADGAWPTLLDDFVAWKNRQPSN